MTRADRLWLLAALFLTGGIAGQMFVPALGAVIWSVSQ